MEHFFQGTYCETVRFLQIHFPPFPKFYIQVKKKMKIKHQTPYNEPKWNRDG